MDHTTNKFLFKEHLYSLLFEVNDDEFEELELKMYFSLYKDKKQFVFCGPLSLVNHQCGSLVRSCWVWFTFTVFFVFFSLSFSDNKKKNFMLAFDALEKIGVYKLLNVEDMVCMLYSEQLFLITCLSEVYKILEKK